MRIELKEKLDVARVAQYISICGDTGELFVHVPILSMGNGALGANTCRTSEIFTAFIQRGLVHNGGPVYETELTGIVQEYKQDLRDDIETLTGFLALGALSAEDRQTLERTLEEKERRLAKLNWYLADNIDGAPAAEIGYLGRVCEELVIGGGGTIPQMVKTLVKDGLNARGPLPQHRARNAVTSHIVPLLYTDNYIHLEPALPKYSITREVAQTLNRAFTATDIMPAVQTASNSGPSAEQITAYVESHVLVDPTDGSVMDGNIKEETEANADDGTSLSLSEKIARDTDANQRLLTFVRKIYDDICAANQYGLDLPPYTYSEFLVDVHALIDGRIAAYDPAELINLGYKNDDGTLYAPAPIEDPVDGSFSADSSGLLYKYLASLMGPPEDEVGYSEFWDSISALRIQKFPVATTTDPFFDASLLDAAVAYGYGGVTPYLCTSNLTNRSDNLVERFNILTEFMMIHIAVELDRSCRRNDQEQNLITILNTVPAARTMLANTLADTAAFAASGLRFDEYIYERLLAIAEQYLPTRGWPTIVDDIRAFVAEQPYNSQRDNLIKKWSVFSRHEHPDEQLFLTESLGEMCFLEKGGKGVFPVELLSYVTPARSGYGVGADRGMYEVSPAMLGQAHEHAERFLAWSADKKYLFPPENNHAFYGHNAVKTLQLSLTLSDLFELACANNNNYSREDLFDMLLSQNARGVRLFIEQKSDMIIMLQNERWVRDGYHEGIVNALVTRSINTSEDAVLDYFGIYAEADRLTTQACHVISEPSYRQLVNMHLGLSPSSVTMTDDSDRSLEGALETDDLLAGMGGAIAPSKQGDDKQPNVFTSRQLMENFTPETLTFILNSLNIPFLSIVQDKKNSLKTYLDAAEIQTLADAVTTSKEFMLYSPQEVEKIKRYAAFWFEHNGVYNGTAESARAIISRAVAAIGNPDASALTEVTKVAGQAAQVVRLRNPELHSLLNTIIRNDVTSLRPGKISPASLSPVESRFQRQNAASVQLLSQRLTTAEISALLAVPQGDAPRDFSDLCAVTSEYSHQEMISIQMDSGPAIHLIASDGSADSTSHIARSSRLSHAIVATPGLPFGRRTPDDFDAASHPLTSSFVNERIVRHALVSSGAVDNQFSLELPEALKQSILTRDLILNGRLDMWTLCTQHPGLANELGDFLIENRAKIDLLWMQTQSAETQAILTSVLFMAPDFSRMPRGLAHTTQMVELSSMMLESQLSTTAALAATALQIEGYELAIQGRGAQGPARNLLIALDDPKLPLSAIKAAIMAVRTRLVGFEGIYIHALVSPHLTAALGQRLVDSDDGIVVRRCIAGQLPEHPNCRALVAPHLQVPLATVDLLASVPAYHPGRDLAALRALAPADRQPLLPGQYAALRSPAPNQLVISTSNVALLARLAAYASDIMRVDLPNGTCTFVNPTLANERLVLHIPNRDTLKLVVGIIGMKVGPDTLEVEQNTDGSYGINCSVRVSTMAQALNEGYIILDAQAPTMAASRDRQRTAPRPA